ncbi:unnamed protein product, partial [marine sediment metagenome]
MFSFTDISKYEVTLHFWRIYFQARFNIFLEKFVKDADAGILMFNLTSINSLKNIEMYIGNFRIHDPTLPIFLLGNKVDLINKRTINLNYIENYVSRNDINI